MWVAVDVAELEDHVSVHLRDLGRHGPRIDVFSLDILMVINVAT